MWYQQGHRHGLEASAPGGVFKTLGFFPSFSLNHTFTLLQWQPVLRGVLRGLGILEADANGRDFLVLPGSGSTKCGFFSREITQFELKNLVEDRLCHLQSL